MTTGGKRRRIFRWSVRILAALVAVLLLTSVVFYGLAQSAKSRWERLAQELRSEGQPLTYAEIESHRTPVPASSNAGSALREAGQVLKSVTNPSDSGVLLLDSQCKLDFFDGIQRQCLPPTRKYVEARQQALALLSEMAHHPAARLDVSYEGTTLDTSVKMMDVSSRHRALGKLLTLNTVLQTIDGDVSSAVESVVLQLRMSEPLYAEPEIILQLVAIANDSLAVTSFENLLQAHELADADLERLQLACSRHVQCQTLLPALLGVRASFIRIMTDKDHVISDAKATLEAFDVTPPKGWNVRSLVGRIPFRDDWFTYENRVQGVAVLTRLVEASDNLTNLLAVAKQQQASLPRFAPGQSLIRIMLPSLTRGIELHARLVAHFRCLPVAIAAERFRIANGRFPNAGDELVPAYLAEVPRDPFSGEKIRLAKTGLGIVAYSVGENLVDDGGNVVPAEGERFGRDFGIRLSNPDDRGIRFIDNDAEDDGGHVVPHEE